MGYSGALVFPIAKLLRFPIITNMDGLEWRRGKWNKFIQALLRLFELRAFNIVNHHLVPSI